MSFILPTLPPQADLETKAILKKVTSANRYLAELKGVSGTIPNQAILINTLSLQEAKDSSAIENIIATHDEMYKEELFPEYASNAAAKEVQNYAKALRKGFELVSANRLLTVNHILTIQAELEKNRAGLRKLPGTALVNDQTGETVYTSPQDERQIIDLMNNLETFINHDSFFDADPLVKMALVHYQFESIHPFYDGNGRTGRIISVLYLVQKGLLDIPVFYLSRAIIRSKSEYYALLQKVRDRNAWEEWMLYLLDAIETTSKQTIRMIEEIRSAYEDYKNRIRAGCKFFSVDLLNNLFCHPYTRIEFLERDLQITRKTASKYLDELSEKGFLVRHKLGKSYYFINVPLFEIFTRNWD